MDPGEYINPSHIGGIEEGQAPGRKRSGSISGHPSEWGKMIIIIPADAEGPRTAAIGPDSEGATRGDRPANFRVTRGASSGEERGWVHQRPPF